jgi:hypothetical protein
MGNNVSQTQVKPVEKEKEMPPPPKPKKDYRKFKDYSANKVNEFVFL